jgi:subtilase family serine protease
LFLFIIGIVGVVRFRTISNRISLFQRQYGIDAKNKEE